MKTVLTIILAAILLAGCATTKGTEKDIDSDITINVTDNWGDVYITPGTDLKADIGDTDQELVTTIEPKMPFSIPFLGGTSNTSLEGTSSQSDVTSKNEKDESIKDSQNPVDNSTTQVPQPVPVIPPDKEPEIVAPTEDTSGWSKVGLRDERVAGKWFTWLDRNGSEFKPPLIVGFPECDNATLTVTDPTNAWGVDGNTDNHNQMFYFSGSPDKQEDTHMGCKGGCSSIFSPPDCERATYALINQPVGAM